MREKIINGILLLTIIILATFAPILNVIAKDKVDFDSKFQLTGYLSYNIDIINKKFGYLDNDNNLDLVVAHEKSVIVYEKVGDSYEKKWEISAGDSGFIDEDSSITALGIGDILGRPSNLDSLDNITSILAYDGCSIKSPGSYNQSYLKVSGDGYYYDIDYNGLTNGSLIINVQVPLGFFIESTEINIRIKDNYTGSIDKAFLQIYNPVSKLWYNWINLKDVSNSFTLLTSSSSNLGINFQDCIQESNRTIKFRFWYNDTSPININIDYFDLIKNTISSKQDIVIGGYNGEICIITPYSSSLNTFKVIKVLDLSSYDNILHYQEDEKYVTTILIGDIENDGSDEIILGNNRARLFALNWSKNSLSKIPLSNDDNSGILWELSTGATTRYNTINTIAAIDSTSSNVFVLFIGTKQNSIYTISFNYGSMQFQGLPVEVKIIDSSAKEIQVADIVGDSDEDLIIGTLDGKIIIFEFTSTNYADSNSYSKKYDSEDLIKSPSYPKKMVVGDFKEKDKNALAIGTTQTKNKIMVLTDGPDFETYWDSGVYIREEIVSMDKMSNSGEDDIIVTTERRIYFLSVNFDDQDEDGLSDLSERQFYRTDPKLEDTDGDDLIDGAEIFVYGTDPLNADTDGDLIPDGWEIAMGTDPLNPMSSIILIIAIPVIIALAALSVYIAIRKYKKQRKLEYERVKNTPNLMPQVRRLIIQRLENFNKDFEGFKNKSELAKFRRNLSAELTSIILDRLYNFLEYLRLKGIIFSDREEEILKEIVIKEAAPIQKDLENLTKSLLMYETKYKVFKDEFAKILEKYADWKKPATKAKGKIVIEELIRCPKCGILGPKDSAFCLECGNKLK